jgi:penicillin-binding protein 1A
MSEDERPDTYTPDYVTRVAHTAARGGGGEGGDGATPESGAPRARRRRLGRATRSQRDAASPVRGGDGAGLQPTPLAAWDASPDLAADGTLAAAVPAPPRPAGRPPRQPPPPPEPGTVAGDPPGEPPAPRVKPRVKKLRLAAILVAVLLLGLVSFVFGMFMAVASDLQPLENYPKFNSARNSVLLDDQGRSLGLLTDHNRILVTPGDIPPLVKDAVISIEDKRFYSNSGIDPRGIARAFFQDILHKRALQGASTIEQQFVKNALQAQSHRTIFEKLREAALAYHLTRKWSKDKIITEYLNTIYFGSGAYGIESAARTYFGHDVNHQGCGTLQRLCVKELKPWEAAMLAAMIASPSAYDPAVHPVAAKARRDLVLKNMWQQGYISHLEYQESVAQTPPAAKDIQPPQETSVTPATGYFTTWVRQQLIDRYGAQRALEGGLKVRTTLDLDLQRSAELAINNYLADPSGPSASLVAIDNATGAVRAMVGGRNYNQSPFNLATEGERQPGSSFKAFVLAQALREGVSPDSVWSSRVKTFTVPGSRGTEHFVVHNDNNAYSGTISLADATAYSDNSVFAEVGIKAGTRKIARLAERMGIRTPVSTNPAMTIGGLKTGVTPLDMAHAYETLARGGQRVSSSLASDGGPTGIEDVQSPTPLIGNRHEERSVPVLTRVLPPGLVSAETQMLEGVIQRGTGKAADIGEFAAGKTGTTENYGDAWFVGWNSHYTVAVWVGYPNGLRPMKTDFNGGPVLGGTFPALIWHDFMTAAIQIDKDHAARQAAKSAGGSSTSTGTGTSAVPPPSTSTSSTPGTTSGSAQTGSSGAAKPTPSPSPAPPSSSSGGGSSGTSSGTGSAGNGSGGGSGSAGGGTTGSGSGSSSGSSGSSGGTAGPSGGTGAPPG